ncbi:MAG: hypothetical protein KAI66_23245, partial [Lentisphaeria bacterium]|nr:hypothetical protein [Lentisphaeria bacterium]
ENDEGIIVTRPVRQGPQSRYVRKHSARRAPIARDLQLSKEVNRLYRNGPNSGVLTFHEYYESRLQDFDAVVGMPSRTWLVGTIPPAGRNNLERYASWMAGFDPGSIFDGGWQTPMGRETEMREFAAEYRSLPLRAFAALPLNVEPVTCRTCVDDGNLVFYLVNRAPYPARVQIRLSSQSEIVSLSTGRALGTGSLTVVLEPFALRSFRANLPATIAGVSVSIADEEHRRMEAAVRALESKKGGWQRAVAAAGRTEVLHTCDFGSAVLGELPRGWRVHPKDSPWTVAKTDEGGRALFVESKGSRLYVNTPPFDPGSHEAIRVTALLRGTPGTRARLFVTGQVDGEFWSKQTRIVLTSQARPVVLTVPELPAGEERSFSVRVDIMGAGELWLQGYTITPHTVSPRVATKLVDTIDEASALLNGRRYAQLERLLDSYWGREALRGQ